MRLAHVLIQPIAVEDVASALADGIVEITRPQQFRLDELVRHSARAPRPRKVITDPRAPYSGAELHKRSLVPAVGARLAETRFDDWLNQSTSGNS